MEITEIFAPGGPLAENLPNYEKRDEQLDMALRIEEALVLNANLIVEAGTGVGKSLAYLIPFIRHAKETGKKAVISTYTKTLQEQLIKNELPFLQKILSEKFNFALCLGNSNYLCLRRLSRSRQTGLFDTPALIEQWDQLARWSRTTVTGLRLDADFKINNSVWMEVCREGDLCLGRKCSNGGRCFFNASRAERAKADILVTNHHLFFTDIASGGRLLPDYETVLFDEAHNVEDVAADYLGLEASYGSLLYLLRRIYNSPAGHGLVSEQSGLNEELISALKEAASATERIAEIFFNEVLDRFGTDKILKRVRERNIFVNILDKPLFELCQLLKQAAENMKDIEKAIELSAYSDRFLSFKNALTAFLDQSMEEYVYWVDIKPQGRRIRVSLYSCPINVAPILKEKLYNKIKSSIMTSATLAIENSFFYIKERLGLEEADELLLGSPFNYAKQALLYTAPDMPDPSYSFKSFEEKAVERMNRIASNTKGGVFALFTSYSSLNKAYNYLCENNLELNFLKQGAGSRWNLLETFKQEPSSVLLATNTFWQGIDVPGKALRCVIIFKLPFSVPDHPLTEARLEKLKMEGKDPFRNYQIPRAVLMLKQGIGRLIRTKHDRGIIAILDPRITTRGYGRSFIRSFPNCATTTDLNDIKAFLYPDAYLQPPPKIL